MVSDPQGNWMRNRCLPQVRRLSLWWSTRSLPVVRNSYAVLAPMAHRSPGRHGRPNPRRGPCCTVRSRLGIAVRHVTITPGEPPCPKSSNSSPTIVLLYVVLMGGSGFAIKALISSSIGEQVLAKAQASLPVDGSIDGGEFDIAQWFLFRPAITFENLRVGNPERFSSEHLLRASRPGSSREPDGTASPIPSRSDLFELIEPARANRDTPGVARPTSTH